MEIPPYMYTLILIQLTNNKSWDFIITIVFSVFGGVMSIVAWLFKRRMEAYDKHLEECTKRAIATGRMDERLESVEKKVNWVGNCIISIGTKVGAHLPNMEN